MVLLLGWAAARDVHLAYYVRRYQSQRTYTTIVLIKARLAVMVSQAVARKDVSAAVPVIEEAFSQYKSESPGLLIHLFSNGGSCLLSTLYDVYAARPNVPQLEAALPPHITVFDSAPSAHYEMDKTVYAIMIGIPRGILHRLVYPFIQLVGFIWWVQIRLLRFPDKITNFSAAHNDRTKNREVKRVYIYSDTDALVEMSDILQHAREAQQKGFVVSKEMFQGSPHVAHARTDADRYWRVVDRTWRGTQEYIE